MTYTHNHFGIYAAIRRNDTLLVIRKARGPYTGMYDLPGGSPEQNEMPEQTLVREVLEETGCIVTGYTNLGEVEAHFHYQMEAQPGHLHHKGILFTVSIEGEPTTEADGHDSNGCVWMPVNQLTAANATPFVHQTIAQWENMANA